MIDKLAAVLAALVLSSTVAFAADPYVTFLKGVEEEEIDDGDTPLIETLNAALG